MGNQKKFIKRKPLNNAFALKRVNPLEGVSPSEITYKNVPLLKKFLQERGRIRSREITGVTIQEQRKVVAAIKNARELALLPFVQAGRTERKTGGRR